MEPMYDPVAAVEENYLDVILRPQRDSHEGAERLDVSLGELALRPAVTVGPEKPLSEVIQLMIDNGIGSAIVSEFDRIEGIFTERDVLNKVVLAGLDLATTPVQEVMSRQPETLGIYDSISFAINLMSESGYRHIPVTDQSGKPLYVVSVRDLAAFIADCYPENIMNLPPQAGQYAAKPHGG